PARRPARSRPRHGQPQAPQIVGRFSARLAARKAACLQRVDTTAAKTRPPCRKESMPKLKRKRYEKLLEPMQRELVAMARWLAHSGKRVVVLFEGRDTAGKGGAIEAIAEHVNPRRCRVVALPAPNDRESTQWYFQRYVPHLPAAGEIVLFDRSWYNRAGVEKVMGFATDAQVKAFLQQAPAFEKLLVDDGILLFKYWLCC